MFHGERGLHQRVREAAELLELRDVRPLGEVVVLVLLDGVQDLLVDDERRPHRVSGVLRKQVDPLLGLGKDVPRPRDLELHEGLRI